MGDYFIPKPGFEDQSPPYYFILPGVPQPPPQRPTTDAERAQVEAFLTELHALCGRYGVVIKAFEDGIELAAGPNRDDHRYCNTDEVDITATAFEDLRWL